MSRRSAVLRRLFKVSAVALGAGLVVTACSPVKLGSAAIVGNERITIATLDTEVTNLSRTVKLYPGTVQLSQEQQTQQTLTWLIRFEINDELARRAGITVSTAEAQKALAEIYSAAKASAQAQGIWNVTLGLILVANGIRRTWPTVSAVTRPSTTSSRSRSTGAGAHQHRRAVGHDGQAQQGALPGGQGPEGPGQPPVRSDGLQPGRGRPRARDSGAAGRPAKAPSTSGLTPAC